jgi:hypothetical protein
MRLAPAVLLISSSLATVAEPLRDDRAPPTAAQIEFFENKVRPILATNCHKCHGPKKQEGELRLDSRANLLKGGETGAVVVPGDPAKSELIAAINYGADSFQMPPDGKLKPEQIAALTKWVKMGAPWPAGKPTKSGSPGKNGIDLARRAKHWSFQPVAKPFPPTVKKANWPRNPIDRFILARLDAARLRPAPPAGKRTMLRRLSYDLTGLPPTVEEIRAFLDDDSPSAYERAVDRFLASPRYGERWSRHWLDLVRFAETSGHEFDYEIPHAWPYRDYVIRAFNHDLPYNRFVVEHIAGDLVDRPRRHSTTGMNESVIGTAFYWFGQGKHSPVDIRAEECDTIDNQLDVLGKTFLGLTIGCSRCHDHKFDPIRSRDYYALAGYLQSSRRQLAVLDSPAVTQSLVDQIAGLKSKNRRLIQRHQSAGLLQQLDRLAALLLAATVEKRAGDSQSKNVAQPQRRAWLKHLSETAAKNTADPFHAWAVLSRIGNPRQFAAARTSLVKRLRDLHKAAIAGESVFTDFAANSYDGWFVGGQAFSSGPTRNGDFVLPERDPKSQGIVAELLPAGLAHSGLISGRLQGTMRSPTFTIENRYIDYRIRRRAGKKNPGRPLKNGQVHLIVDGFQFAKNPLYGGLSINVANDGRWRWYRQDLNKLIGSKAYIEIEDADDGTIVVDRVLFSNAGSPPEQPNGVVIDMLDDPAITTAEQLAARYRQLFIENVRRWADDKLTSAEEPAGRIAVVNWLLEHSSLFATETDASSAQETIAAVLQEYRALSAQILPPKRVVAMTDGTSENAHLLIRGNHKKPGQLISRRFLEVLAGVDQPEPKRGSGRLSLARKIADPANPLTARVMVNRLWLHHFGRGIVASPDNFGRQGQPPSHPRLLDWLAAEFIDSGWSIKHMHRLMVLSATYRMSSRIQNAAEEETDPQNRLLHRMPIRRLEGEAIRDGLLAISGSLVEKHYGAGVLPFLTPFMEGRGRPQRSGPLDGDGRRSIYINVRRNFLTPMFLAFDLPTPFTTVGRRSVSNVPAQALTMMNNPFVLQQAAVWAKRVLAEPGSAPRDRIGRLYESAFARLPTDMEMHAALEFLEEQGQEYGGRSDPRTWTDLCHVLINVKEFVFVN